MSGDSRFGLKSLLGIFAGLGFRILYINNGPVTVGSGEILGGGGGPILAGFMADRYGIRYMYPLPLRYPRGRPYMYLIAT